MTQETAAKASLHLELVRAVMKAPHYICNIVDRNTVESGRKHLGADRRMIRFSENYERLNGQWWPTATFISEPIN